MESLSPTDGIAVMCAAAGSIGFVHTLLGPDHYLPFVAMARSGSWSLTKTIVVTLLCGIGHVLSSAALGSIGVAVGIAVFKLESVEAVRVSLAAWALLGFGLVYFSWGLHRAVRNKPHTHIHVHAGGGAHRHGHVHIESDAHVHTHANARTSGPDEREKRAETITPWVLFTIFVLGPCEPLIPILMYPAAKASVWGVALVTLTFGAVTLGTMTTIVLLVYVGTAKVALGRFHRYSHAAAGLLIIACATAVLLGF